ncbi:MAG: hypothetical protein AAFX94_03465, partial [Myxococcota bacterium]
SLLETYAKLEEQRSLLANEITSVKELLDKDAAGDESIEDELAALENVGVDLEETYQPLIELREELLRQRLERCEEVAGRVKEASDELLESRDAIERLRTRVEELQAKEKEAPKLIPVEEPPVQGTLTPAPTPEPAAEPTPLQAKVSEAANDEVVDLETRIDLDSEDNFYCGLDGDEVGVFASTIEILPLGQRVHVRVQVNGTETVTGHGRVKWFRDWDDGQPNLYPGMGIELLDLDDGTRRTIDGFMETREPWLFV